MRIQHNIMAMNAYRNYNTNTSALSKNLEKLSSGYKINRAGDDAAGLAISEKMRAQITGLNAASKNVKDGISLVKTAEGAMQEIQDMLNRMDYLATQSANGTYDNEVDRANLQKEVDALKSEINRIADSANFNGIKLLDGKAGINTTAFSFENADAVKGSDGTIDISDLVAKEADGSPKVHLEGSAVTAAAPSATIDLGDLALTGNKVGDKIKLTIAGKDYELTSAADNDLDDATKIATALKAAIAGSAQGVKAADGTHDTTAANNDAIRIGNAAYTIGGTGSTITLTYAGRYDSATGTTYKAETTYSGTADQAAAINGELGFDVAVKSVTSTDGTKTGDVIHKATNVEHAKAAVAASKAGIDINLSDLVEHGNTLTIDGKTFFFKTDATSSVTAPAGATTIDVSAFKDEEKVHAAADLLSKQAAFAGQDSRQWKIGVSGDGTTIHIDQTVASGAGKALDTYDKLTGVISAKGQATAAKAAGITINVTPDKISVGNQLTVDGKTLTVVEGAADTAKGEISKNNLAADMQAALGTGYTVAAEDAANPNKITIRSANTAATSAPVITGNGITLQIGDTSDGYNQLKVKIGDMHVNAMGTTGGATIADISIANQEGAQAAVQTIKDAINYVSGVRGDLGAVQNRLEHTANNLSVMAENIQDAESTIRDTDVAEEMMSYVKNNILVQSAQAMLAQANQVPQGVLQLLG